MAHETGGVYGRLQLQSVGRERLTALVGDARSVHGVVDYGELFRLVDAAAAGFLDLGVRRGDRVGVASENFDRWLIADLALLSIGAVSVPRGGDASTAEIAFCLAHAQCRFSLFETAQLLERVRPELPPLEALVVMKGEAPAGVRGFDALLERGRKLVAERGPAFLSPARAAVGPDDLATIVYTSGTTGNPKGVMLTHGNLLHNVKALAGLYAFRPAMTFVSFLPTWHTFERVVEYVVLDNGLELHYGSKRSLKADLVRVRPHFLVGVPRVWEALFQGVAGSLEKLPPAKKRFVEFTLGASRTFHRLRRRAFGLATAKDGSVPREGWPGRAGLLLGMLAALPCELLARRLVYSRLKAALGGRLEIAISGGGPLPPDVEEFFLRAGVPFFNGYGLTETSPVLTVRHPHRNIMGTIGPPLPETEIRIVGDDGSDLGRGKKGVIQARGPQVMNGYWNNESATRACLSADGWFDTGDIGLLSLEGDVMITGRAKDTIVLRGGENVEPENIETALSASPCFLDIVVVGHAQKSLAALVVPNLDVVRARKPDLPAGSGDALCDDPRVVEVVKAEIAAYVSSARGFRTFEMVTRFRCLPRPFSTEDGTLTHTMKKRRRAIEEKYADLIARLFAGD